MTLVQIHTLVESSKVVREDWNGYNVLHDSASRVAALDIGFLQSASAARENPKPKFVYLLGSDDFTDEDVPSDAFVVYQVRHIVQFLLAVLRKDCSGMPRSNVVSVVQLYK